MKICTICKISKNYEEFSDDRTYSSGKRARCKPCDVARQKTFRTKIRDIVFGAYGNVCVCCGENRKVFLTIDHIAGGGTQHYKELGSAGKLYILIRNAGFPSDYQLLCRNCNWAKYATNGNCPHKNCDVEDERELIKDCGS